MVGWSRAERQVELELLASILESVEATEAALVADLERMSGDESRASWFFNASRVELSSVPRDSIGGLPPALFRPNTADILQGPLPGLLNSAQLSLVQAQEVRRALNDWLRVATCATRSSAGEAAEYDLAP